MNRATSAADNQLDPVIAVHGGGRTREQPLAQSFLQSSITQLSPSIVFDEMRHYARGELSVGDITQALNGV